MRVTFQRGSDFGLTFSVWVTAGMYCLSNGVCARPCNCYGTGRNVWLISRLQCPSGIWSRDFGFVSSNVRHHFVSPIVNDYSAATLDESGMLKVISFIFSATLIELSSSFTVDVPKWTSVLKRFSELFKSCLVSILVSGTGQHHLVYGAD